MFTLECNCVVNNILPQVTMAAPAALLLIPLTEQFVYSTRLAGQVDFRPDYTLLMWVPPAVSHATLPGNGIIPLVIKKVYPASSPFIPLIGQFID